MNKRTYRDICRFIGAIIFFWLYIPHFIVICLLKSKIKKLIFSDINKLKNQINIKLGQRATLIYFLHNNSYYRSLFYHRIGPIPSFIISWYRPGCKYFCLSYTTLIDEGFQFFHPFSTIINAQSIGKNFTCLQCTTIGSKAKGRPIIGDNVSLGANVTLIGNITIGNNVIIGAGSVVVKDVPDNVVIGGNPAKIIRHTY